MAVNYFRLISKKLVFSCPASKRYINFPRLSLATTRLYSSSISSEFEIAKSKLNSLANEPDNDTKLKIYGLFKQATVGSCSTKQPGVLDFVGRAKWSAWNSLGKMTQEDASKKYVDLVNGLLSSEKSTEVQANPVASTYKTLKVTKEGVVMTILLNRPDKKNAISNEMYVEIASALNDAAKDPRVIVCVMTGAGDHYCSGNDLNNFVEMMKSGLSTEQLAEQARGTLQEYVKTFIDFPKLLIGLINGPATGIAATTLGLFDSVYASDKATFHTPFTQLGQVAEGCSSFTFPSLMGSIKANEVLMYNQKLSAAEACQSGLVTKVFPDETFQKQAWEKVKYIASLPPQSLLVSKKLIRSRIREQLYLINAEECTALKERWQSDECMNAVASFFTRKAKL